MAVVMKTKIGENVVQNTVLPSSQLLKSLDSGAYFHLHNWDSSMPP